MEVLTLTVDLNIRSVVQLLSLTEPSAEQETPSAPKEVPLGGLSDLSQSQLAASGL